MSSCGHQRLAAAPWVTQTPHNPTEAISQATLVNNSISNHQGSSPTPISASTRQMVKGTMRMAHEMTLMSAELRSLRAANDALSKRRRAKKKKLSLRQGGTLSQAEGSQILADKEAEGTGRNGGGENGGPATARKCGKCGNTGHNARTCQVDEEMSNAKSCLTLLWTTICLLSFSGTVKWSTNTRYPTINLVTPCGHPLFRPPSLVLL